jgi:hypothetical protein
MANEELMIKLLQVARSLILTVSGNKYTFTTAEKDVREKLKEQIERHNKKPSKTSLERIIKSITPKAQEIEKKAVAVKAKAKHKVKETKRAIKQASKELAQVASRATEVPAEIAEAVEYLKGDKRFIVRNKEVFLAPFTEVPIPKELVFEIDRFITEGTDLQPLINFWMLALLNPNPIARTKLFGYLSRHKLIVTPSGYFVTYRMVKKTEREGVYTSAHTGEEKYIMGEVYKIPRSQCDEDGSHDCSRGLHTGTPDFIGLKLGDGYHKEFKSKAEGGQYGTGYDGPNVRQQFSESFGNQAVIVLVNPMHVVSVPNSDTRKLRACELYFCKETTVEEVLKMQTKAAYSVYEDLYREYEATELKKMLEHTKLEHYSDPDNTDPIRLATDKKNNLIAQLFKLKENLKVNGDAINMDGLSLADINKIIQSRIAK